MASTYEQRVLIWLRQELGGYPLAGPSGKNIVVEDIRLEKGKSEGDDIVILFREAERPNCLFGFRMLAREPVAPGQEWKENEDPEGRVPTGHGTVIYGNLMEQLQAADMGLPKDCAADDSITWI
jgi:hypothetical protein